MKITLHTNTGIEVQLQPALFQTASSRGSGHSGDTLAVPFAPVGAGLLKTVRRNGVVATSTALLALEHTAIGVLYACGDGHLAALVFDLAEHEVRRWLAAGQCSGSLPLALTHAGQSQLVLIPTDDDIIRLAEYKDACAPATSDDLVAAMQAIVGQFDDAAMLSRWGVDIARLASGSVSLLTPSHALEGAAAALH